MCVLLHCELGPKYNEFRKQNSASACWMQPRVYKTLELVVKRMIYILNPLSQKHVDNEVMILQKITHTHFIQH